MFKVWIAVIGLLVVAYAVSAWKGWCYKATNGYYGGVWAGQVALGWSREPWASPGWEIGPFPIPFTFGFLRAETPRLWIVGVPLWLLIVLTLPGLLWAWWRHAVYRTVRRCHPFDPPRRTELA